MTREKHRRGRHRDNGKFTKLGWPSNKSDYSVGIVSSSLSMRIYTLLSSSYILSVLASPLKILLLSDAMTIPLSSLAPGKRSFVITNANCRYCYLARTAWLSLFRSYGRTTRELIHRFSNYYNSVYVFLPVLLDFSWSPRTRSPSRLRMARARARHAVVLLTSRVYTYLDEGPRDFIVRVNVYGYSPQELRCTPRNRSDAVSPWLPRQCQKNRKRAGEPSLEEQTHRKGAQ